jgi:aryl-alcohol dehydrogenase-like predicted oxidoreductase
MSSEAHDLAVLARSPLAMGFLSGKYHSPDQLASGDVRRETALAHGLLTSEQVARVDALVAAA